jgi:hypothetical protein
MTTRTGWRKASYSNDTGECVEVCFNTDIVLIRDSKYLRNPANDPALQPIIKIAAATWRSFLETVASGEQDTRPGIPAIEQHRDGGATLRADDGTALTYTAAEWAAFTAGVRAREFEPEIIAA